MNISDNIVSAFLCGVSSFQEDMSVLNMSIQDQEFDDYLSKAIEIDNLPEMDDLKKEFNERIDNFSDFKEHKINIK